MTIDAYGRFDPSGGTYWDGDKKYKQKESPPSQPTPVEICDEDASCDVCGGVCGN